MKNLPKSEQEELLSLFTDVGIEVNKLSDILFLEDLDWAKVNQILASQLSTNISVDLESAIFLIRKYIRLGRESGFQFARNYVQTQEKENQQLCEALSEVGVNISSIYDLVNTTESYPNALPILISSLPKLTNPTIKEGVVRALTLRGAPSEIKEALFKELRNYDEAADEEPFEGSLKWAIGNAISVVASRDDADFIIELLKNKNLGKARQQLIYFLAQRKIYTAKDVLIDLLDDESIAIQVSAINALRRLGIESSIPALEKLESHPEAAISKAAQKALKKIREKASPKSK